MKKEIHLKGVKNINKSTKKRRKLNRERNLPQRCHICFGKERDG